MNWKIKATLQKILAASAIGDKLNHLPVTVNKQYHQNVFLYQSFECLRKYSYNKNKLKKDAIALEIGTGYSILSSVILSLLGFQQVISVDVTRDIRFSTFKKQIIFIDNQNFKNDLLLRSTLSNLEIDEKINLIKETTSFTSLFELLNIVYIAPYNFLTLKKYQTLLII